MKIKQKLFFGLAIIPIAIGLLIPETVMQRNLMCSLALLVTFLLLQIGEVFSVFQICLIELCLMPLLGVTQKMSGAFTGFSNSVIFFILASFGIGAAFTKSSLTKKMLHLFLKYFGKKANFIVLGFMLATALTSSIMSNVPTCVIYMSIAQEFLRLYEDEESKRICGKPIMLGVTLASMMGGMMTPAGSSINIMALNLLEQYAGVRITFGEWALVGIPVTLVILPLCWFILIHIFKPGELPSDAYRDFAEGLATSGATEKKKERMVFFILLGMIILWVASSWIKQIDVVLVALVGCIAFSLPKIRILSGKELLAAVNWEAVFLVGTVLSLGNALVQNGIGEYLNLAALQGVGIHITVSLVALLTFIGLIIVPVAPMLVTILIPTIVTMATTLQTNPAILVITATLCACNCYLFPLDTVCMITFSQGYYRMSDMPKIGALVQTCLVGVMMLVVPTVAALLGWI